MMLHVLIMVLSLSFGGRDIDPVGACCFGDSCELRNRQSCKNDDGSWLGPQTTCYEAKRMCGPRISSR